MPDQIGQLKQAGFTDQEIGDWTSGVRSRLQGAGFNDDEINSYLTGSPNIPAKPPQAFLDRLLQGTGLASLWSHLESGQKKADADSYIAGPDVFLRGAIPQLPGWSEPLHIFSEEYEKNLRDAGVLPDPATGRAGPLRRANEALLQPIGAVGDLISRLGSAAVGGLAETIGESVKRMGAGEPTVEATKREVQNFANAMMADQLARGVHVSGIGRDPTSGRLIDLPLGGAARPEDFPAAAKTMVGTEASPAFQAKLQRLYEEKGLLPAEVAHDAANDVTVTQALASTGTDLPERYTGTAVPPEAEPRRVDTLEMEPNVPPARPVEAPVAEAVPAPEVTPQSLEERRISGLREATDEENNLSTFKDGDTFRTSSGDIITLQSSENGFQIRTGVTLSAPFTPKGITNLLTREGARRLVPREEVPPEAAPMPPAPEGIPFMITAAQRAELGTRGFTPEQIRNMTPSQAQEVLRTPQAAPLVPPEPTGPAALPEAVASVIPNAVESIKPSDLAVDANRFQFKAGTDEEGVSDRLRDVQNWDPVKAGLSLVWEDENGQRFIVDGHQRLALAKRIAETDPAQDPRLNAIVIRAADGVTDTEARVIAAAKNIAEGTGTPIDAAKILRDRPDLIKELPPRSELVRQARGLAELGDEPFGMIVNEVVPPAYGAIVGRLAPADPRLQGALIDLLNKTQPANATQAEAIVRQGISAGTRTETQATLFGDQDVVSSLYADRARVLDGALQQLRRDRLVFAAIVRNEDVINAVGNRLETTANANRAAADAQAIQILQVLANRRGPLSDALNSAARRAAGGQRAAAVREFVDAIRQQAESGDLVRAADGLERGRADAGRQDAAQLVDPDAVAATARDTAAANADAARLVSDARSQQAPGGRLAVELLKPTTTSADDLVSAVPGAAERIAAVRERLAQAMPTDAPVAEGGFREPDGSWTPERAAVHDRILQRIFTPEAIVAATPQAGEKPTLHVIGGRGGSGKSWFTGPHGTVDRSSALYLNSDDIKEALPGYQGWNAALYHEESTEILGAAEQAARDLGLNVILDATMRSSRGVLDRAAAFKAAGYRIDGHYMFVPPEIAAQRAIGRFMRGGETGRFVPPEIVLESTTNEASFDAARNQFDHWEIYDNTGGEPTLHAVSEQARADTAGALRQRPAVPPDRQVAGLDVRSVEEAPPAAAEAQPELVFGPETGAIRWGPAPPKTPLETAQDSILSKLSVDQPGERRPMTFSRLYTAIFDKLYPLSETTSSAMRAGLDTAANPYRLARLLSGLGGKVDAMLRHGTLDWGTYRVNGPGLEAVLDPVKEDLDGFRAFITAARGLELDARGIETGLDLGQARFVVREGIAKYAATLENLVSYQNRVAAYLRDSGVLSADGYKAMLEANQLYVPFQRVIGDGDGFHGKGATLQASNPIARITGSERDIIDPLESIIRNTAAFVTMAEKNAVGTSLINMLEREGKAGGIQYQPAALPIPVPADPALDAVLRDYLKQHGIDDPGMLTDMLRGAAAQPEEEGTVSIFRDGTRYTYKVDPELAIAMKGLDQATAGMWEKIFSVPANWLRAGALTVPDFAARHAIRDFLYATVTGRGLFTPLDMVRGIIGQISKDEDYWRWLQAGGANNSMVSLDRQYLQENLEKLTQQTGLMTRAINVVVDPNATWLDRAGAVAGLPFRGATRYVLQPLQVLTQLAEDANHLGQFKRALRQIEAEPSVPAGMVRLYRVETETAAHATDPSWANSSEGMKQARGRYFTDDKNSVQFYLRDQERGQAVHYIDVPAQEAEQYRVSNIPLRGDQTVPENPRAFSGAPDREFFVTPDLAAKKRLVGPTKAQLQEAAWTSRDIAVDASRIGAKTRAYNMITAFANIKLQDTDRVVRVFINNPVATSLKIGGAIVVPSALLWWSQHDDPRYKEIPQWQKDLTWVILTDKWEDVGPAGQYGPPAPDSNYRILGDRLQVNNGAIFRIPKPWAMGLIFGSGTERALEAWSTQDPGAFRNWFKSIANVVAPDFIPTGAAPIINQYANRDTFTNRTLIPGNLEKMMPEYQYTPYTTETAKKLGQMIGAFPGVRAAAEAPEAPLGGVARALTNPILLENYIRGWGGNLGVYALQLADFALRKEGLVPDPPRPASTLADIPVVKAFIVRYPTASAQSIQDFHDVYAFNKMHYDTWMAQAKGGDEEAARRVAAIGGPMMFVQFDQMEKTLIEHQKLIQDIYKNPEMKPEEKRQLIDQTYYSMIQVAHAGNAAMRQADAVLSGVH